MFKNNNKNGTVFHSNIRYNLTERVRILMMMTTMISVQNNDDDSDIKHAIISNDNSLRTTF